MTTEVDATPEVVLHVGTMKSGTSYIQAVLRRNRRALNQDGVQIPRNMVPAVVDVLKRKGTTKVAEIDGAWERFLALVASWQGRSVIASQEFLSGATVEEAKTVVATLPPGKVRVVITARDLVRVIPSHWQTVIKNGGTWPFPEYTRLVLGMDGNPEASHRYSRGFWRHHDIAAIVENWAAAVGLDNVVLVTVPPVGSPPALLWDRFSEAAGLAADRYEADANAKSNVSLTYAETEMMREVNLSVRKPLTPIEYRLLVNRYLANQLLRQPPDAVTSPDRPRLGAESYAVTKTRADDMLEAVAASGVRVVGDLEDLRVGQFAGAPDAVDSIGPQEPIPETVSNALAKLVVRIARLERDLNRARKLPGAAGGQGAGGARGGRRGKKGGGGKKAGGGRRGANQGQEAATDPGGDDDFDSFETTAYDEHEMTEDSGPPD